MADLEHASEARRPVTFRIDRWHGRGASGHAAAKNSRSSLDDVPAPELVEHELDQRFGRRVTSPQGELGLVRRLVA
jgi:hypothetical protein